jgi:hypothetical protein
VYAALWIASSQGFLAMTVEAETTMLHIDRAGFGHVLLPIASCGSKTPRLSIISDQMPARWPI